MIFDNIIVDNIIGTNHRSQWFLESTSVIINSSKTKKTKF